MNIVQIYPQQITNDASDEDKDDFYSLLQGVIDKLPRKDNVDIILGDPNAKIGQDNIGYEGIMGQHGLGQMKENGERFAHICAFNSFVTGGSVFPHKRIHKATCVSPGGVTGSQSHHFCTISGCWVVHDGQLTDSSDESWFPHFQTWMKVAVVRQEQQHHQKQQQQHIRATPTYIAAKTKNFPPAPQKTKMADTKSAAENGDVEKKGGPENPAGPPKIMQDSGVRAHGWRVIPFPNQSDPVAQVEALRNMQMRDDDVMIVAYPKCGTHWMWEVTKMLRKGVASHEQRAKEAAMLEFSKVEAIDKEASPRTLNSHLPMCHLPQQIKEKKIKLVHLVRNPKDALVSFYFHVSQMVTITFPDLFERYLANTMSLANQFDFLRQIQKYQKENPEVPVMTIYYEDMKQNPVPVTKDLAKFLGLDVTEDFCKEVVDACSFSKMKEIDPQRKKGDGTMAKEFKSGPINMYRKGQVGDWKNHLTVAQSEMLDDFIAKEAQGMDFRFTFV
ncbi:sulfotransferase 1A1 [Aplysia californica]|uniref:Sulfotransferase 1A1 n=1 Tax=Aplysia californica TaxID=6500 RepID=A0ABM1AE88_APLCA|nr:sulfotransferase 1A1 [Aplysia californica]